MSMNQPTLSQILAAHGCSTASELSYMSILEAAAALALEQELLLDAAAGVDLRIRLIGTAVSK